MLTLKDSRYNVWAYFAACLCHFGRYIYVEKCHFSVRNSGLDSKGLWKIGPTFSEVAIGPQRATQISIDSSSSGSCALSRRNSCEFPEFASVRDRINVGNVRNVLSQQPSSVLRIGQNMVLNT